MREPAQVSCSNRHRINILHRRCALCHSPSSAIASRTVQHNEGRPSRVLCRTDNARFDRV